MLAACDQSLPTAVEIEAMDVNAVERRSPSLLRGEYFVDGELSDPDSARAYKASDIVAISIEWPRGAPGPITRVTTRRTSKTLESKPDHPNWRGMTLEWSRATHIVKPPDPTESDEQVRQREFPGLILVDGVVSDNASIRGVGRDVVIEVVKREWAGS